MQAAAEQAEIQALREQTAQLGVGGRKLSTWASSGGIKLPRRSQGPSMLCTVYQGDMLFGFKPNGEEVSLSIRCSTCTGLQQQ